MHDELRPIKFLIYKGELLLGRVKFHKDLLPKGYEKSEVKGGGTVGQLMQPQIEEAYLTGNVPAGIAGFLTHSTEG